MAMTSVTTGTIQTRWATTAVCQLGLMPSALNHRSRASPSTGCGKNTGSRIAFWNSRRPFQS